MSYFSEKKCINQNNLSCVLAVVSLQLILGCVVFAQPGYLDRGFGNAGKVTTAFNFASAVGVALQSKGRIVAAGNDSPWRAVLARYLPDGRLDRSFGIGGKVYGTTNLRALAIAIQLDDRIVVAGSSCVTICGFTVVRYMPNGSLDTSFDGDGKVIISGYVF